MRAMTSDFDELEEAVMADMRKHYSEKVIDHFLNPRNVGEIQNADGFGRVTGSCGDTMEIYLKIKDNRLINASFLTDGCGTTIACGSMVTEMINDKTLLQAQKITNDDIVNSLGGLPEDAMHCALLAANTLKEAFRDYLSLKNEPWKRAYRRY